MIYSVYAFMLLFVTLSNSQTYISYNNARRFPDGFLFGAATSAYQIEGAWSNDGKGENIFDRLLHTQPCFATDCSNGDMAAQSYFLYKRDIEMCRELGLDFYRFSLSWTRILPTGFSNKINKAGVEYYNNLIDELLSCNIVPIVTLYHWDLPQKLQDLGGITNPHFVDWFGDYAKVAYEIFGDRVKYWSTINEPRQICEFGYENNLIAPAVDSKGIGVYICSKNLLLAHARAYRIYDEVFRERYGGIVFIVLNSSWFEPASESKMDVEAADDLYQFYFNQYAHPIFSKNGDYPEVLKKRIAEKSFKQGFFRSRLVEFSLEEIEYVRGTSDLLGLNHYTSYYVYRNESALYSASDPSIVDDQAAIMYQPREWMIGETDQGFAPWGFYKLLIRLKNEFDNPPIFIAENGFQTLGGLYDDDRVLYLLAYLYAMLDAIDTGVRILGYTVWSLMDNFEWFEGYTKRFGLYEVDFNSTLRVRTPRKSAFVYREIVRSRHLNMNLLYLNNKI